MELDPSSNTSSNKSDKKSSSPDPESSSDSTSSVLACSGKWSDMESDFDNEPIVPVIITDDHYSDYAVKSRKKSADLQSKGSFDHSSKMKVSPPKKELSPEETELYESPVLWIKRTFRVPEDQIRESILTTFSKADMPDVKIAALHITTNVSRDHAYMILNSSKASDLLLDGSLSVIVQIKTDKKQDEEENSEASDAKDDIVLWFEKADHLVPSDSQDPFTLYLWQLPNDIPSAQLAKELRELIETWCPIISMKVGEKSDTSMNWAKIVFDYEFDTQKCIYMLNYANFRGGEIRAGFCNLDRSSIRKPAEERSRHSNPRPSSFKPPSRPQRREAPPKKNNRPPRNKSSKGQWEVVGREGRSRK